MRVGFSNPPPPGSPTFLRWLPILFFFSGASSLIFETIFTRLLTYTFGNTAYAVSTVLAAFLGGLALGAFAIGRWVDRRGASLLTYGTLELLVGLYCLFTTSIFSLSTKAYVGLYHLMHLGMWSLTVVRFGLAAAVILIPTMLMGGTLPVLARCVAATGEGFQPLVDRLYAWNTLGAAAGTLASTYLLMPWLGVQGTIRLACAVNLAIFLSAAAGRWKGGRAEPGIAATPVATRDGEPHRRVLLAAAFLTGVVALVYEVVWTHILGFLVGNTVYAFGVMLFTFLCGLGWGAHLVARHLARPALWCRALAATQLFLGLAVFITLPLWNHLPDLFAQGLQRAWVWDVVGMAALLVARMAYSGWSIFPQVRRGRVPGARLLEFVVELALLAGLVYMPAATLWRHEAAGFVAAELLRFIASFYLLILPCLLLGISFPLLLNLATQAGGVGASVGGIYAANTAGTVLGSVLTGFLVLPALGSHSTLRAAATLDLLLGLGFALLLVPLSRARRCVLGLGVAALVLLVCGGAAQWDARGLMRGTYVYFDKGWSVDRVLYFDEDVQGGLTSVVTMGQRRVLLSNGKFQGDNDGEVGAQARFALTPILFTPRFERALVIGLGTGNTLRVLSLFPFRTIEVVEIAPHIVDAARRWFGDVNAGVFDRDPRVKLTLGDGRNVLLLTRQRYDLITIEVTSIWISGEADLYNREFYELCRSHLAEHGVLQQWVQIHHMRPQDLGVILNTAAQVFAHVAFFQGPEQGLLIASPDPLECDARQVAALENIPGVRAELVGLGIPSLWSLLGEMMLFDSSFRRAADALAGAGGLPADFVSTDDRPYLEYQTPKGNTAPYDTTKVNVQLLERFRPPPLPPELAVRSLASDDDRNLLLGYVLEGRGDPLAALTVVRRVGGSAAARAAADIAHLTSWPVIYKLAFSFYQHERLPEAEKYFLEAIRIDPNQPEEYLFLGMTRFKMGRTGEAIAAVQHAIAIRPGGYGYHFALGVFLKTQGDLNGALREFQAELVNNPGEAAAAEQAKEIEMKSK
jgi:spermidine synthase